jgi:hypothetical protein
MNSASVPTASTNNSGAPLVPPLSLSSSSASSTTTTRPRVGPHPALYIAEILHLIFGYLEGDVQALAATMLVNKRWKVESLSWLWRQPPVIALLGIAQMRRRRTYGRLVRVLDANHVPLAVLDCWAPYLHADHLTLPRNAMQICETVHARLLHKRLLSLEGPAAALTSDVMLRWAPKFKRLERLKLLRNAYLMPGAAAPTATSTLATAGTLLSVLEHLSALTTFEDDSAYPAVAVDYLTRDVFVHLAGQPRLRILYTSGEVSAASLAQAIERHRPQPFARVERLRIRILSAAAPLLARAFRALTVLSLHLGETHHRVDDVLAASPGLQSLAVKLLPGAFVSQQFVADVLRGCGARLHTLFIRGEGGSVAHAGWMTDVTLFHDSMPRDTLPNLRRLDLQLDHRLSSGSLRLFVERWPRLQALSLSGMFDLRSLQPFGDAGPLFERFDELRLEAIVPPLRDPCVPKILGFTPSSYLHRKRKRRKQLRKLLPALFLISTTLPVSCPTPYVGTFA